MCKLTDLFAKKIGPSPEKKLMSNFQCAHNEGIVFSLLVGALI